MYMDLGEFPSVENLFSLNGRVAMITGAGGGIGRVLGRGLASAGAAVALCDVDDFSLTDVQRELSSRGYRAMGLKLDLSDQTSVFESVRKVHENFGRLDILINCAAINKREPILEVTQTTFDQIVSVNLRGLFQMSQAAARLMKESGGGKIVNIGSLNSEMALKNVSVYGATKGAVKQLTMAMALEWANDDIQVNCVIPGFISTPLSRPVWEDETKSEWMRGRIAARRPGEPQELLGAVIYLCAPASSYVTGQSIIVDGGVLAGGTSW